MKRTSDASEPPERSGDSGVPASDGVGVPTPLDEPLGRLERSREAGAKPLGKRMDALEEIKRLYYNATRSTIQQDLARAVTLLKAMPTEDDRERAAVYMDGLSQMRSEWGASGMHDRRRGRGEQRSRR